MNLPTATAALATGALEPAFGVPVDITGEEGAALAAVLGGVGLRDRGPRAPRAGLRVLPVLAGILVALAQDVGGGVAGEGKIGLGRRRVLRRPRDRAGEVAVVGLGISAAVIAGKAATAGAEPDHNHRHDKAGRPHRR